MENLIENIGLNKLWGFWVVGLSGYRVVGLSGCRVKETTTTRTTSQQRQLDNKPIIIIN